MDGGFIKIVFWNKWELIQTVREIIRIACDRTAGRLWEEQTNGEAVSQNQSPHLLAFSCWNERGWGGTPDDDDQPLSGKAWRFLSSFAMTQFGPGA